MLILFCTTVNAVTTYEDGYYSFAELADSSFTSLYGFAKSVSEPVDVVVPDVSMNHYVQSVYEFAFYKNSNVKTVDFSKSRHLNHIDSRAFSKSTLSGIVTLPASIQTLGFAAFSECDSLTEISFGTRLKEIPEQCCYNCPSLTEVNLSQNAEKIGKLAFANCINLNRIFIPYTVNEISKSAFENSKGVVILCYRGSYALQYAKDNGFDYEILDPLLGDVNGDEEINIMDATIIQKKSLGIATADVVSNYDVVADVNRDGIVNIRDVTLIQMYVAGIITEF